jgi:outer membrane protein TolC
MKTRSFALTAVLAAALAAPARQPASAQPAAAAAPAAPAPAVPAQPPAKYVAPEYIRKAPSLPAQWAGRTPRKMSLADAIETSLRRNLALAIERERVREVAALRGLALGAFEPFVQAAGGRQRSKSPPETAQEAEGARGALESTRDFWDASLIQRLPTGTELRLDWNSGRSESTLGTAVAPEVFRSVLTLGVVQPLLRDFSFSTRIQRAPVLRARFASEVAREEARLRALLTVKATEDAYWDLVESWKTYEVNVVAHKLAEDQLELTRRQIAAGVLPESDVIGVEGTLAQRQVAVVRAEAQIERSADLLRTLMNLPPGDWEQPLIPVDAPSFVHVEVPFETALQRAESYRPELQRVRIDLKRIALDVDVARNARLPRLDLRGAFGSVGQDQGQGAEYSRALEQVRDVTGRQWSVALTLGWAPLGVAARAELRRLNAILRENEIGRDQLMVGMRAQIREALRAIDTAERQLLAAAKFRDLAERSLDVEQRRFLNGLASSSNFLVAQRQAELAQARLAELEALIAHEKASSDLQLAMGQLLEARSVRFDVTAG